MTCGLDTKQFAKLRFTEKVVSQKYKTCSAVLPIKFLRRAQQVSINETERTDEERAEKEMMTDRIIMKRDVLREK